MSVFFTEEALDEKLELFGLDMIVRAHQFVEAGYKLNGSLLRAGLVDELLLYLAPCLIGDAARGLRVERDARLAAGGRRTPPALTLDQRTHRAAPVPHHLRSPPHRRSHHPMVDDDDAQVLALAELLDDHAIAELARALDRLAYVLGVAQIDADDPVLFAEGARQQAEVVQAAKEAMDQHDSRAFALILEVQSWVLLQNDTLSVVGSIAIIFNTLKEKDFIPGGGFFWFFAGSWESGS